MLRFIFIAFFYVYFPIDLDSHFGTVLVPKGWSNSPPKYRKYAKESMQNSCANLNLEKHSKNENNMKIQNVDIRRTTVKQIEN